MTSSALAYALPYALLADLVLGAHLLVVLFVVGGLAVIVAGNLRGWSWVNGLGFRLLHLAAIAYVAAQAWLGVDCPLTTLEMTLRARAGLATHGATFIGYRLQQLLYYDAPPWVFTVVYSLFALAVVATWWRYPPRRQTRRAG